MVTAQRMYYSPASLYIDYIEYIEYIDSLHTTHVPQCVPLHASE